MAYKIAIGMVIGAAAMYAVDRRLEIRNTIRKRLKGLMK